MQFTKLLSLLILPVLALADHEDPAVNRTFTMTTLSSNATLNNLPILVAPPSGVASMVIGNNFTNPTAQVEAFIYNGNIFRKCTTSPTGACLGFLTKEFGGALTGWYFQFSDNETSYNFGPGGGPIVGGFNVTTDPSLPAGSPCKPAPLFLSWGGGIRWTLCNLDPGTYSVNSSPIPDFAHNFDRCPYYLQGVKFQVKYTRRKHDN